MSTIKSSAENLTLNADGANNDIKFQSNGSEVASIDQAGSLVLSGNLTSLGIDDNATSTAITIDSSERVLLGTDTGNAFNGDSILRIQAATGDRAFIQLKSDNDKRCAILLGDTDDAVQGEINYDNASDAMYFNTSSTERLRIQSGGGISFNGDTAAANALDDYEEGTWTPSYTSGGGGGSAFENVTGLSSQWGEYTKVGRMVTCWSKVILNAALTNKEGVIRFHGLPFTSISSNINYITSGSAQFYNGHGNENTEGGITMVFTNDTQVGVYKTSINGATGNEIQFMVQYQV